MGGPRTRCGWLVWGGWVHTRESVTSAGHTVGRSAHTHSAACGRSITFACWNGRGGGCPLPPEFCVGWMRLVYCESHPFCCSLCTPRCRVGCRSFPFRRFSSRCLTVDFVFVRFRLDEDQESEGGTVFS